MNYKKHIIYGFICICVVYMLFINNLTPMWNDEFAYNFISGTNDRIYSLHDLLYSVQQMYFNWTGRIVIQFFVQLFSCLDKSYFNLINSVIIVLFVFLIIKIVSFKGRVLDNIAFVICNLWFFLPRPGETIFWLSGAVNYLWPTTLMLLFIYYIDAYIFEKKLKSDKKILLYILSFSVAFSHENIMLTSAVYCFFSLVMKKYNNKEKIQRFDVLLIIFFSVGAATLVLSPGSQARKDVMYGEISKIQQIINYKSALMHHMYHQLPIIILSLLLLLFLIYKRIDYKKSMLFLVSGIAPYFIMFFAPDFPERTTFPNFTLILISMFFSVSQVYILLSEKRRKLFFYLECFLMCAVLLSLNSTFSQYTKLEYQTSKQIYELEEQRKNGVFDVKVSPVTVRDTRYVFVFPVKIDKNYTSNKNMASYYNVKSISLNQDYIFMKINSPVIGAYNLYYDFGEGFKEQDKGISSIWNQYDNNSLYFFLPQNNLESFRFDFPGSGDVVSFEIEQFQIYKGDKVIDFSAYELENAIYNTHEIQSISIKDNRLVVSFKGYDSQIHFDYNKLSKK